MDELKEGEIERQLLLRDTAVRAKPGAQERPDALNRIGGIWLSFVSRYNIDFIKLNLLAQLRCGAALSDRRTQGGGHGLHIVLIEGQFLRDLAVREIQTHKVKTQNPDFDWLVVARQGGTRQIVKLTLANVTLVALTRALIGMFAPLLNPVKATMQAVHPCRPPHLADHLLTFGIID